MPRMKLVKRSTTGGPRKGAGRPKKGTKVVAVRLTPAQHEKLKRLGGSTFIQTILARIEEGSIYFELDSTKLDEEERREFAAGWIEAGGIVDDDGGFNVKPLRFPWTRREVCTVTGSTPREWGAAYWRYMRDRVE